MRKPPTVEATLNWGVVQLHNQATKTWIAQDVTAYMLLYLKVMVLILINTITFPCVAIQNIIFPSKNIQR